LVLALAFTAGVGIARSTTAAPAATTGCAPHRPAIAADAAGHKLRTQPRNAPIPCASTTGFGAGENRIFATNHAVIYAPAIFTPGPAGLGYGAKLPGPRFQVLASPGGLAVTRNNGASWRAVLPLGMMWEPNDAQEFVDRTTGRFFYYDFGGNPFPQTAALPASPDAVFPPGVEAHLMWTADDGRTWHHSTACCPLLSENPRFVAARAPSGHAKPTGYPNVLYFCANASIMYDDRVPGARICSRSLDGGSTWSLASTQASHPVPQHAECGSSGEDFGADDGRYPQAEPDGSLVMLVSCGGKTFLARSTDEGTTWPIIRAAGTIPAFDELRTDTAGNLYGFKAGGGRVLLRVSRNGGRSWSAPIVMTAPGVAVVDSWNPAVRAPGNAVVSYYGQRAGQGPNADGYLTVTRDALARAPVVWSAMLNDPRAPMLNDGASRPPPGDTGFLDFNGSDIGPDGTAWASFIQDCAPTDVAPPCGDGHAHAMYGARGFAGRLVWPH
jgi:hypothetical protein